jgi:PAS domain S-box-containing protein
VSPESEINQIHILIVEDSPTQAEQLQYLLENAGYRVTVANNGKEALSRLKTEITDLVLSDIVMPEMDGYELCRTIKQDYRFRNIPVILVTVLFDPQDVIRGLECGANNFITKPYMEKYLLTRIKSVLVDASVEDVDKVQMGLEIYFAGKRHYITSSRMQILNILLSTYETAVQKNQELIGARNQLRDLNEHLEDLVAERTLELEKTNLRLTDEIELHKKTWQALERKTRAYHVISACNQVLVRTESEQDFISDICSTLVTVGGYRAAWIGYARNDRNKTVEPVAWSGLKKDQFTLFQVSWEERGHGNGPTGTAIRTANPHVIHDILNNPTCRSWVSEAAQRNYSTVAALPLTIKGEVIGALTIYSADADAFDADEMQLLEEMADDLAYGIETLRISTAHDKAELELKASEIRYRRLFEAAKDGILILDGETGAIIDVNPFLIELLGIPYDQFMGKNIWDIGIFRDIASSKDKFDELKEQGYIRYEDMPLKSADGEQKEVEFVSNVYLVNKKKVIQCNIRDITERKLVENALRESEVFNRNIIENSLDCIIILDPRGNLQFMSTYGQKLLEIRDINRYIGKPWVDFWTGEEHNAAETAVGLAANGRVGKFTGCSPTELGTPRWWDVIVTPVKDKDGGIDSLQVISRDVTKRRQAEEEKRLSFERFKTVMDGLDALVYVVERETNHVLFLNKYGKDLWGNIEGKVCWQSIQKGQSGPCPFCTNDRIVDSTGHPTEVYRWEFQNTITNQWYDCRDSAIRWIDGRLVRLEIASDITDRKRAEEELLAAYERITGSEELLRQQYSALAEKDEALRVLNLHLEKRVEERTNELQQANEDLRNSHEELRAQMDKIAERDILLAESEERYRAIADFTYDWEYWIAPDGKFVYVSPSCERITGYRSEEFMSDPDLLVAITHPDDRNLIIDYIAHIKDHYEKQDEFEFRIIIQNGEVRWMSHDCQPVFRANGEYLGSRGSNRDVTDRRKMTEQIEASLAEKETLVKEVHHRVKNNLQIITSILNLQIRKIDDPGTIEVLKDSQTRVQAMALVHEHLYRGKDFSHIDLKDYIAALGRGIFQMYEAANRGIQFDLNIRDIYVDINTAIPLGLISNELITNSLKYAFKDRNEGKLTITATEDPQALTVIVTDNGVGLPEEIMLKNLTSLGLRLVHTLVDQLDGTVTIDRTEGTKFTFTIPKTAGTRGKAGP